MEAKYIKKFSPANIQDAVTKTPVSVRRQSTAFLSHRK